MLQHSFAPALQRCLRHRELEHAVLDEKMPTVGKRHCSGHVLAAGVECFFRLGQDDLWAAISAAAPSLDNAARGAAVAD